VTDSNLSSIGSGRRFAQCTIDVIVFYVIWSTVLALTSVRFPFGLMQRFSQADYDAYVWIMGCMTLALFSLSVVLHLRFGGSLGKLALGHRTVQLDGSAMPPVIALKRSAALFLLGIMILAPGPLVAFFFGRGSELLSLIALAFGLVCWLVTAFPLNDDRTMIERDLGLVTVRRNDLPPSTQLVGKATSIE
jgi:uncharacterized RDD family membrane protein YckC